MLPRLRWRLRIAAVLVLVLGSQVVPAALDPFPFGAEPAFAADPVPPPAAINPAPRIQLVTTPGPTYVTSDITTDTVWGPGGSPYVAAAGFDVSQGVSLTLLPGTVVKLGIGNGVDIQVYGQLLALGTPQQHVV